MMKKLIIIFVLSIMMLQMVIASDVPSRPQESKGDVFSALSELGKDDLSKFYQAINDSGFIDSIKYSGPITIFAPTNEAFNKIPDETLKEIMENRTRLRSIIAYHIVPENISSNELRNGASIKTYQGENLTVSVDGNTIKLNNATIKQTDIKCNNGIIHLIDTILMPMGSKITGELNISGVTTELDAGQYASTTHKK
jgi:uncharacterized surface protein with fasciclin (FAS1) repeats